MISTTIATLGRCGSALADNSTLRLAGVVIAFLLLAPPTIAQNRGVMAAPQSSADLRASFGDYHAVIIGIDDYQSADWPDLNYAERDASDILGILTRHYGFPARNVIHLQGDRATRRGILNAIRGKIESLGEDDNLFIYYAGHGQLNPATEEGFWIPVEGDSVDDSTWISFGRVRKLIEASNAETRRIALITDSCYGGALARRSGPTPGHTTPELAGYEAYAAKLRKQADLKSRQVIASGGYEEVPDKSEFAWLLKTALLENKWPIIDMEVLYSKYISSSLSLQGQQDPIIERLLGGQEWNGQFVLLRSDTDSQRPAPKPASNEAKITFANESNVAVEVFHSTADGREMPYYELQPGQSYIQPTYIGHAWLVKDQKTGRILKRFTASQATQRVTIPTVTVVPKPMPQPKVNGHTVAAVDFGRNQRKLGVFEELGDGRWQERGVSGSGVFNFVERGRDEWSVYLYDQSRQVSIQLDLHTKNVYYSDPASKRRVIYRILSASSRSAAVVAKPPTKTCSIDAGPIWNQQDATKKCPRTCRDSGSWTGHWWTTVPGKMSVCQCSACVQ